MSNFMDGAWEIVAAYPDLLTIPEAQEILRVSRATIQRMAGRGELKYVRVGPSRQWRILRSSVEEYIRRDLNEQANAFLREELQREKTLQATEKKEHAGRAYFTKGE